MKNACFSSLIAPFFYLNFLYLCDSLLIFSTFDDFWLRQNLIRITYIIIYIDTEEWTSDCSMASGYFLKVCFPFGRNCHNNLIFDYRERGAIFELREPNSELPRRQRTEQQQQEINKFNVAGVFYKLVHDRKNKHLARKYNTVVKTSYSSCFERNCLLQ